MDSIPLQVSKGGVGLQRRALSTSNVKKDTIAGACPGQTTLKYDLSHRVCVHMNRRASRL